MTTSDWSTGIDQGKNRNNNTPDFFIGEGCKVKGTLKGKGRVVIEGELDGDLKGADDLEVGPAAVVKAGIAARRAQIQGQVVGDILCAEKLVLQGGADVEGDLSSPSIVIEEGVRFRGRCSMGEDVVGRQLVVESAAAESKSDASAQVEVPEEVSKEAL